MPEEVAQTFIRDMLVEYSPTGSTFDEVVNFIIEDCNYVNDIKVSDIFEKYHDYAIECYTNIRIITHNPGEF